MRIDADRNACVGSGQCARIAPHLFDQDEEDGLVVVVRAPGDDEEGALRLAVSGCPARALRLRES
ncbi:ferredoxin [Streptomyces achromogenes]|uniref:ferredoxin n=1 Tax=Streptomyces achromogenes TaxID=67255 RepID=UPI0036F5DB40